MAAATGGLDVAQDALLGDITRNFDDLEHILLTAARCIGAGVAPGPLVSRVRLLATVSESLAHVVDTLTTSGLLANADQVPSTPAPEPAAPELSLPYYEGRLTELVGPFTEDRYTELHAIAQTLLSTLMRQDASS